MKKLADMTPKQVFQLSSVALLSRFHTVQACVVM